MRRLFPELHAVDVPNAVARPLADAELGVDVMLSTHEIIEAFGWQDARRRAGHDLVALPEHGELGFDPAEAPRLSQESITPA